MAIGGWVLGVMLAVLASVVSNLGLNLQKRAHLTMERLAKEREGHHHHHHHNAQRRGRSGSVAVGSTPDAGTPGLNTTPEKPVNPLSPSGILKKGGGGGGKTAEGGYHLMDESVETEDALVRRDDKRRADQQRGNKSPVAPTPAATDKYKSAYELASGGVDLDPFSKPLGNGARRGSTNSNGHTVAFAEAPTNGRADTTPTGRVRSMSAVAPHAAQRAHRSGHSSRHGTGAGRRRSSINVTEANAASAAAAAGTPAAAGGHYTRQPMWVAGIVCVILGSLFDFAALAFVDQAVVAPLGSLTLVSNVFFAPLLLKEKVNRKQLYCTALIIAGSILAVAFAPHAENSPSVREMFGNFAMPRFIIYAVISCAVVALLRYISFRLNKIRRQDMHAYHAVARYHTFAYAACAGIMGAQSVLFAKCTAMLLASTFSGKAIMFVFWQSYFILAGLGVTIFLQIRWLNSGLQRFSALLIVPIFQSFWILVSVIAGMIFFGEYAGVFAHAANAVMFPMGLGLTICGVYFLTRIAAPGADEAKPAAVAAGAATPESAHAATVSHRRRSRSTARGGSLTSPIVPSSGVSSPTDTHANVSRTGTSDGMESAVPGTSSSPLLSAGAGVSSDSYGVQQSPRNPPSSMSLAGSRRGSATAPGGGGGHMKRNPSLDRIVDAGSYDTHDEDEDGATRDDVSDLGEDDEECSSDEEEEEEEDDQGNVQLPASNYHTLMMHSLAPINFLMTSLIPSSLMEEAASPSHHRHAYFEENASGFGATSSDVQDGGFGGPSGGEGINGGLPYANIFRVREERDRAGRYDEENPAPSPGGINLFSSPTTSPRVVHVAAAGTGGSRLGRVGDASPGDNGRSHAEWSSVGINASAASSATAPRNGVTHSASPPMTIPESPSRSPSSDAPVAASVGMFDPSYPGSASSTGTPAGGQASLLASAPSFSIAPQHTERDTPGSPSLSAAAAPANGAPSSSSLTATLSKQNKKKAKNSKKHKSPLANGDDSITDSLL